VDLVFFDTTSVYLEGEAQGELAHYGHSRGHRPDRPQMMGLLMLQDGMPISYQVLSRNSSDVLSFLKAIESLKEHFF